MEVCSVPKNSTLPKTFLVIMLQLVIGHLYPNIVLVIQHYDLCHLYQNYVLLYKSLLYLYTGAFINENNNDSHLTIYINETQTHMTYISASLNKV